MGYKGRVHLKFSAPLDGEFENAESMAGALDRAIVEGLRIFPTQVEAAERLGMPVPAERLEALPKVTTLFRGRIETCPAEELPFLLASYANLLRNREELRVSSG